MVMNTAAQSGGQVVLSTTSKRHPHPVLFGTTPTQQRKVIAYLALMDTSALMGQSTNALQANIHLLKIWLA